jgi:hypothetical protein
LPSTVDAINDGDKISNRDQLSFLTGGAMIESTLMTEMDNAANFRPAY